MKQSQPALGALLCICQMGIVGVLFGMSYIQNKFISMQINYVWLLAAVLAVYFFDVIVMRRGIALSVYVGIQAVIFVAAVIFWTYIVSVENYRAWTEISTGIFYGLVMVSAAFFAYFPVSARAAALWFDGICIASAFFFLLEGFMDIPCARQTVVMCIISAVSALVMLAATTAQRNGGGGRARINARGGKAALVGGMCAVTALAVWAAYSFVRTLQTLSGAAVSVLRWCADAFTAVINFLYGILYAIMTALISRIELPEEEGEAVMLPQMNGGAIEHSEMDFTVPTAAYVIAGIIAAAILAFIIWKLRGAAAKAGGKRLQSARVRYERDSGGHLREMLKKLKALITYYWRRFTHRRTAAGLLDYCIRKAGKTLPRGADESGERYLMRLAESGYEAQLSSALASLASSVEKTFYSRCAVAVSPEVYRSIHRRKNWKRKTASS